MITLREWKSGKIQGKKENGKEQIVAGVTGAEKEKEENLRWGRRDKGMLRNDFSRGMPWIDKFRGLDYPCDG